MWILYPLLFFAGFVDSIAGGGGLISLSAYLAAGLPPHLAVGTNKFSAFIGTGLAAAYFVKKGHVLWSSALYSLTGALIGSAIGAKLVLMVDETSLSWILLVAIPLIAVVVLWKKDLGSTPRDLPPRRAAVASLAIGLAVGLYDGFIGPGTGTLLILAFTLILGQSLLLACGNTKIVNFASNLAAVAIFIRSGDIDYGVGIPCALCAIAGNLVGARLTVRNGAKIVRPMMLFVVTLLLAKVLRDLIQ